MMKTPQSHMNLTHHACAHVEAALKEKKSADEAVKLCTIKLKRLSEEAKEKERKYKEAIEARRTLFQKNVMHAYEDDKIRPILETLVEKLTIECPTDPMLWFQTYFEGGAETETELIDCSFEGVIYTRDSDGGVYDEDLDVVGTWVDDAIVFNKLGRRFHKQALEVACDSLLKDGWDIDCTFEGVPYHRNKNNIVFDGDGAVGTWVDDAIVFTKVGFPVRHANAKRRVDTFINKSENV